MENLIKGKSETAENAAIMGESDLFEAVRGISHAGDSHGAVVGINDNTTPTAGPGVFGKSRGTGVWGQSETWHGVAGFSDSTTGGVGVYGKGNGAGMLGEGGTWHGVAGISESTTGGVGIYGKGKGAGVLGEGGTWHGVAGISESTTGGAGIFGKGKNLAGLFEGNVNITGKLIMENSDVLALIKAMASDLNNLRNKIKELETTIASMNSLSQTAQGTRKEICNGQPIPDGWAKVDSKTDPTRCQQHGDSEGNNNIAVIEKL
ncbi:MAG: hypothetical protein NTW29_05670 [Bacteroidetes bacterium]|nr:hypothetical protein [Bacteroidota bacterium]